MIKLFLISILLNFISSTKNLCNLNPLSTDPNDIDCNYEYGTFLNKKNKNFSTDLKIFDNIDKNDLSIYRIVIT